jgi:hypothetical protein
MKYLSLLLVTLFAVLCVPACHPVYTHPAGYQSCHNNYDCHGHGEFCGFVGVDTYPVCRR